MKAYCLAVLLVLLAFDQVTAQWGGAFLGGHQEESGRANFGSTSQPHPSTQMGGGDNTNPNGGPPMGGGNNEYKDQWMPTARPGFEIPQGVKDMIDKSRSTRSSRSSFRTQSRDGFTGGNMMGKDKENDDEDDEEETASDHIPKKSPGRDPNHRRIDQCLRKVAHFCSTRVMNENFAMFNDCVYQMRFRLPQECQSWAEGHGSCADDMVKHCMGMSPADTTECIRTKKQSLSRSCVDSSFYKSMEEGFKEFRAGMSEGMKGAPEGPRRYSGPSSDDPIDEQKEEEERQRVLYEPPLRKRKMKVQESNDDFDTEL